VNKLKKNILVQTNVLVCVVVVIGFFLTALLSYRANLSTSLKSVEQVSDLTSEGIYYQMSTTFSKPVNISLTMANDSLLHDLLSQESERLEDPAYVETLKAYLNNYQEKYSYDSVFLVSAASSRYYNFNGLDRVLERGDPENVWYYEELLPSDADYTMNVDNDEVAGADNSITVFVNCKIWDDTGSLLGVVGVGVRIDGLQRALQEYKNQFGVDAYLLDDTGVIELSTDYSGYEKINLFEMDTDRGQTVKENILNWKDEGTALSFWSQNQAGQANNYMVARYLPDIGWHLVVERDTSALVQQITRQVILTVLVIAVILSIILIIITKVIRRFNRQIVELSRTMEEERQAIFEKATEQLFENIYEIDITHNLPANRATAEYFESLGAPAGCPFDQALPIVAEKQIKEEFRQGYLDTFLPQNVLRTFEAGTDHLSYEFMISKDGTQYYWMRITAQIMRLESDGSIHMLVYRQNIDADKRQEQKMKLLAKMDEMTGFLTKTATKRQIEVILKANPGQPFAYFIFDIDNFKQANDQFGHDFGDSVIGSFTRKIQRHFRKNDVLGRIGGDEFVVFVPSAGRAWAKEKAEALRATLCFTHTGSGMSWHVSASIGVAFAPEHGSDAAALYKNADAALYHTKKQGKNGFTIYDGTPHFLEKE
jgi:diguanylate cyclase (GGDEF)-like protein